MTIPTSDIHSTIQALSVEFEAAFATGNASNIADFYTENAMLLPESSDFIRGKSEISAYWKIAIQMGIQNIELDILEVEQHDDTAIEVSNYTLRCVYGDVIDQGKGLVIWKNIDGVWKLHRDIWNTSIEQH